MEEQHDAQDRKPYAPPTFTDLGSATKKTRGYWGEAYEYIGTVYSDLDDPPDDDEGGDGGGN
ncbi:MAG: hypothetical protein WEA24_14575 [Gemmatimonadota bacterium]